ncbi:LOW QUALITY PROTEIN: ovochymase-2 [Pholidichthys leucotaenia]
MCVSFVGKYCGYTKPKPLVSLTNQLTVYFDTNDRITDRGFKAHYRAVDPALTSEIAGAGGFLQGDQGSLMTPGFPDQNYENGALYQWRITVPKGEKVQLTFTAFDLVSEVCGDFVEIYDWSSDDSYLIDKLCGNSAPTVVNSIYNTMVVRFKSDSSMTSKGFSATYSKASIPTTTAPIITTQSPAPPATSGSDGPVIIRGRKGVIQSSGFPNPYPADLNSSWKISVSKGLMVKFQITELAITGETGLCNEDKLVVSDDYSNLGTLCGNILPPVMVSASETISVTLQSDGRLTGRGFSAKWEVVYPEDITGPFCGTELPDAIQTKGNRLVIHFHADLLTEGKGFRAYWTTNPSVPAPTEPPVQPNPWDYIPIDRPILCGLPTIPPAVTSRIGNGEPATPHSWPWQVSMQVWPASQSEQTFSHTCGGTHTLHKNWVLTAAHCFIRYADELQRWRMCLGKHNLTYTEPSELCFKVPGIYYHDGFNYLTVPTVEFDITLVKLDEEVTPSDEISFACLPSEEEILPEGKKCYATGWGDETGDLLSAEAAEALNQVALPVVHYDTCKRMDYWWFQVKTSMICCGYTPPDELKAVLSGKNRGPLVCQDTPGGPWEVHGITSFGPIGCIMNKKPSMFTRSSAYISWITNVMRRDIYNEHTTKPSDRGTSRWAEGKLVHLHFHSFSLEESQMCLNDKVNLSDKTGSLGTYCSNVPPRDMVSDGNTLHISFSSNEVVVDTGFTATWKVVDHAEAPCGGSFSSDQGEIPSPNWPNEYQAQTVCTWHISIPSAKAIYVAFSDFKLQAANLLGNCVDYVEIFNGETSASQGRFCGFSVPDTITIKANTVVIRFLNNGASQEKGFRGYWTTNASISPPTSHP